MTITDFLPLRDEITAMALHLGANEGNVDDIVQDVFLKLLEIQAVDGDLNRIEYRGEPNKSYIYMIVRSQVGNLFRDADRQRKEEAAFVHSYDISDTPQEVEDNNEWQDDVQEALNGLHFFSRKVFEAYILDGHSVRSLSEATSIGQQTLRNEINYVKDKVKRTLRK